ATVGPQAQAWRHRTPEVDGGIGRQGWTAPPSAARPRPVVHSEEDRSHMQASLRLLNKRRFLPLFVTQLLGAFNDNLFKNAMVLFVVYQVYNDERSETWFSALATGIFILPFFLLSALSGQLADQRDKAGIIRIIKAAEIAIMAVGAAGLAFIWSGIAVHMLAIPLLLTALFA